jgi:hypothetical protein
MPWERRIGLEWRSPAVSWIFLGIWIRNPLDQDCAARIERPDSSRRQDLRSGNAGSGAEIIRPGDGCPAFVCSQPLGCPQHCHCACKRQTRPHGLRESQPLLDRRRIAHSSLNTSCNSRLLHSGTRAKTKTFATGTTRNRLTVTTSICVPTRIHFRPG